MAKKKTAKTGSAVPSAGKPSAILGTRVIYCGDNLEQLRKFPDQYVDLIYIDPPFSLSRVRDGWRDCILFSDFSCRFPPDRYTF